MNNNKQTVHPTELLNLSHSSQFRKLSNIHAVEICNTLIFLFNSTKFPIHSGGSEQGAASGHINS